MSRRQPPNPDDYFDHYLAHREKTSKEGTVQSYETALNHLQRFLSQRNRDPEDTTVDDCIEFIHYLRDQEISDHTIGNYTSSVSQFYSHYSTRGSFETNPMRLALEEVDIDLNHDTHRRDVSEDEMSEFVQSLKRPEVVAIITVLVKTGIRVGELVNIDLRDIHLDHQKAQRHLPNPRGEIRDQPDTLFIPSNREGNKRKVNTICPIDDELKQALLYWISARLPTPPNTDREPLFQLISADSTDKPAGSRATIGSVDYRIKKVAKEYGWWESDGGRQSNVTPHYFRHWFTTMGRRSSIDDDVIDYLRGDVGSKSSDDYRHFWGDEVRDQYEQHIFKLYK